MIAKSLAFRLKDGSAIVLVVCGTGRIDNHKFKEQFHCKASMLSFEDTLAVTGHPVGGVCPFALPDGVKVYLDQSLKSMISSIRQQELPTVLSGLKCPAWRNTPVAVGWMSVRKSRTLEEGRA